MGGGGGGGEGNLLHFPRLTQDVNYLVLTVDNNGMESNNRYEG